MSETVKTASISLTEPELEFLRQMINADGLNVPVKHATVASNVYEKIQSATLYTVTLNE